MMWSVELDVWDTEAAYDKAAELRLKVEMIAEDGPAGGNSLMKFTGALDAVCEYVDYHSTDAEDAAFLKKDIIYSKG